MGDDSRSSSEEKELKAGGLFVVFLDVQGLEEVEGRQVDGGIGHDSNDGGPQSLVQRAVSFEFNHLSETVENSRVNFVFRQSQSSLGDFKGINGDLCSDAGNSSANHVVSDGLLLQVSMAQKLEDVEFDRGLRNALDDIRSIALPKGKEVALLQNPPDCVGNGGLFDGGLHYDLHSVDRSSDCSGQTAGETSGEQSNDD